MLGVSHIMISGVSGESGERDGRMERLLALPGTATRIRVVSDFVQSWDDLTEGERSKLLGHLNYGAPDDVWLRASALTRASVPAEVQSAFLPDNLRLHAPPSELLAKVSPPLMNACLHVFTGHHPVIYYVGAHGSRSPAWNAILREVVRMPEHAMFEVAWEWLVNHGQPNELAQVATELGPDQAERLVELLLERKQRASGEFMPEVWEALFDLPVSGKLKSEWVARMAALAPNVLDSLDEHESWIPEPRREEFLSHLAEDAALQKLVLMLWKMFRDFSADGAPISQELSLKMVELIDAFTDRAPPKLTSTYDLTLRFLKYLNIEDSTLIKTLERRRSEGINDAQSRPERRVEQLDNWTDNC